MHSRSNHLQRNLFHRSNRLEYVYIDVRFSSVIIEVTYALKDPANNIRYSLTD
jgi:hypothetical protein